MTTTKYKLFRKGKFVGYEKIYRRTDGSFRLCHADKNKKNSQLWCFRPVFIRYAEGEFIMKPANFIVHDRAEIIMDEDIKSTTNTITREFSVLTLDQLAETLNKFKPEIIAMDYRFFNVIRSDLVPNNTIIMSQDLADKLGLKPAKELNGKEA